MTRWGTVLCLALVAGCGTGPARRAAPYTPPPRPTISASKARALAVAGTLRPSDVPGYHASRDKAVSESPSGGSDTLDRDWQWCLGKSVDFKPLLTYPGVTFTKGQGFIGSQVDVAPTVGVATRDLTTLTSPKLTACLEKVTTSSFAYDRIVVSHFAARLARPVVHGSDQTVGIRLRCALRDERSAVMRMVVFLARVRHAEVGLVAMSIDAPLPSDAMLTALLTRAVRRVRAAV